MAAATELFLAPGYLATTLEDVARRAQVVGRTKGGFGTKARGARRGRGHRRRHRARECLGRDWMQLTKKKKKKTNCIAVGRRGWVPDYGEKVLFAVALAGGGGRAADRRVLAAGPKRREEVFWTLWDGLLMATQTWIIETASILGEKKTYLLDNRDY